MWCFLLRRILLPLRVPPHPGPCFQRFLRRERRSSNLTSAASSKVLCSEQGGRCWMRQADQGGVVGLGRLQHKREGFCHPGVVSSLPCRACRVEPAVSRLPYRACCVVPALSRLQPGYIPGE